MSIQINDKINDFGIRYSHTELFYEIDCKRVVELISGNSGNDSGNVQQVVILNLISSVIQNEIKLLGDDQGIFKDFAISIQNIYNVKNANLDKSILESVESFLGKLNIADAKAIIEKTKQDVDLKHLDGFILNLKN